MRCAGLSLLLGLMLLLALTSGCTRAPESPWGEPPAVALDLQLSVSATEVPLLGPVRVTLDRYRRADLEVEFAPEVPAADFRSDVTVLPEVELGSGRWQRTVIELAPIRGPGELTIPAFVARAADGTVESRTEEQRLVVTSVLDGHGSELEIPAEPFPTPSRLPLYLAVGAGVLLLLAGLWWFARRGGRSAPAVATATPAHVVAMRAFERLRTAPRTTPAEIETFYVEVSDVLRRYLEDRFGLHAPERTTEEFLRELESGDALAREHRGDLRQFLTQCDLVKFARHRPTDEDHTRTFDVAVGFVESTRADVAAERSAAVAESPADAMQGVS
ncbi:MAG: hypothetical protein NXI31_12340 [bacterium]|nr:hypothetical protein [bacterium]